MALGGRKQYCGVLRSYPDFIWLARREAYDNIQQKNHGKGYAETLLRAITNKSGAEYCITPWDENKARIHIAEKCGFQFRYKFMEYWNCYIKNNA